MIFSIGPFSIDLCSKDDFLGESPFSLRALSHLEKLGAKTYVTEPEYIDKSFYDEFSNYYVRSFESISNKTVRIHFFSSVFSKDSFLTNLNANETGFFDDMNNNYLGFIVLKNLPHSDHNISFGRTVLKPILFEKVHGEQNILFDSVDVCLYGIKLTVKGVQYLSQDKGVGACATSALWMCAKRLNTLFLTPLESAYVITKKAVSQITGNSRDFPSEGLTLEQMLNYLKRSNLDTEVFNAQMQFNTICSKNSIEYAQKLKTFISAYLTCGIPIILNIRLKEKKSSNAIFYHAVLILGFKTNPTKDTTMEIILHDDQRGPYWLCKGKKSQGIISPWIFDQYNGYQSIEVLSLIAPVAPSIRLSFNEIYEEFCIYRKLIPDFDTFPCHSLLFLVDSNSYKKEVLKFPFEKPEEKALFLLKSIPKYVWVIRVKNGDKIIEDHIFDSTAIYCRVIQSNYYKYDKGG